MNIHINCEFDRLKEQIYCNRLFTTSSYTYKYIEKIDSQATLYQRTKSNRNDESNNSLRIEV